MTETINTKEIPVPTALKELILTSNTLLQNYQQELTMRVEVANREMMSLLGVSAEDGWTLDMKKMVYFKQEQSTNE